MNKRLVSASVALAGLSLLLTGCWGSEPEAEPDTAPPAVTVDTVAVPEMMRPSGPIAGIGFTMVGASGGLPWIVGGSLAAPGEGANPTVWTSVDGSWWTAATVEEVEGEFSGSVRASETLAALGGTVWNDGKYESVLWTSADAKEWAPIELPQQFRTDVRLRSFGMSGDVLIGVGTDADGAAQGLRVDAGEATLIDLPEPAKGELLQAQSVVVSGDTVLLVANSGPEGEPAASVSYTSTDLGKTWGEAVEITDSVGFVSGVTKTDEGFVATGGIPRGDGASGPAAWLSADGSSWTAESVPSPGDGPLFTSENTDTWLSTPLARGGVVAAVFGNDNSAVSGIYSRQPGGVWAMVGRTSPNSTNGAAGIAMPTDSGGFAAAIIGAGYARMGIVSDGWTDTSVLAERQDVSVVKEIYPGESDARLTLSQSTFTVDDDLGWSNQNATSLGQLSGDALTETPWDPESASAWSGVYLAADDAGAQLVVGTYFDTANKIIPVQGSFRSSEDAAWTPVAGFEPDGAATLSGAEKIGDVWVAYGKFRASSVVSDPEHGAIWTSADGVSWTRAAGDFGSGTLETQVSGVCALPEGGLIATGWTEVSEGEFRASVWQDAGGTWAALDIGEIGSTYGFGSNCASDEEGVVLGATIGGRDTLQRSTDGASWTEVFRADRGISIGKPVAVEGGFAASGSVTGTDFSGPVVWLSQTGTAWSPVSIPSLSPGSTTSVAPVGEDLVVAMSGRIGDPVTIIRGIAGVIADKG